MPCDKYQTTGPHECRTIAYRLFLELCSSFRSHSVSRVTRERRGEKQSLQQYHKQITQNNDVSSSQMHHPASFHSDSPISNVVIAV